MRTAAFVLACALPAALAPAARADVTTLDTLLAGGVLHGADFDFSGFGGLSAYPGYKASQTTVTTVGDQITFSGGLPFVLGPFQESVSFHFTIVQTGAAPIASILYAASGGVGAAPFPGAFPGSASAFGLTFNAGGPNSLSSLGVFPSPSDTLPVTASFSATGGGSSAFLSPAEIGTASLTINAVPEPGTLALALGGAAGLALRLARPKLGRTPKVTPNVRPRGCGFDPRRLHSM